MLLFLIVSFPITNDAKAKAVPAEAIINDIEPNQTNTVKSMSFGVISSKLSFLLIVLANQYIGSFSASFINSFLRLFIFSALSFISSWKFNVFSFCFSSLSLLNLKDSEISVLSLLYFLEISTFLISRSLINSAFFEFSLKVKSTI